MPYYMRLFTKSAEPVPLSVLRAALPEGCSLDVEGGDETNWADLLIKSPSGDPICVLERSRKDLMEDDIAWMSEALQEQLPRAGAEWARDYLKSSSTLYLCQYLHLAFTEDFDQIPPLLLWAIAGHLQSGILHAEGEGFSNETGDQITWEFSDDVTGPWRMAVSEPLGGWTRFDMDLGNAAHREAFKAGTVPGGIAPLDGDVS